MAVQTKKTAGDDIDSRCLKCKAVTNHTIIAITGSVIEKVQCNTCDARHNYRAPKIEKEKSPGVRRRRDGTVTVSGAKPKKAKTPGLKVSRGAVNFDAFIQNKDISNAITYSVEAHLSSGVLVEHKVFGLGIVMTTMLPNKAEVKFREHGTKIMICNIG